jgi:protein-S-isoprenylcysteine O-methyltransferase Ste14
MGRVFGLIYGVAAYLLFLVVFLYAVGFVANWMVPKSIDSGVQEDVIVSILNNAVLLGIFAVQHSVMARPGFKAWWTRIVPQSVERSTYVVFSSLVLILLFWKWQPLPGVVWSVQEPAGAMVLWGLCALGWLIALASTFAVSHFDLFGLRQVYLNLRNERYSHLNFRVLGLYRLVRHPLMLGFLIAFWATPHMTIGHLLFAAATTVYILIALQLEERDLIAHFGEQYREYRQQVPMLLPVPRKTGVDSGIGAAE